MEEGKEEKGSGVGGDAGTREIWSERIEEQKNRNKRTTGKTKIKGGSRGEFSASRREEKEENEEK